MDWEGTEEEVVVGVREELPEDGPVLRPPVQDPLLPLLWGQLVLFQHSGGREERRGK